MQIVKRTGCEYEEDDFWIFLEKYGIKGVILEGWEGSGYVNLVESQEWRQD